MKFKTLRQEKYEQAREFGYSSKEAQKIRDFGAKRYDEAIRSRANGRPVGTIDSNLDLRWKNFSTYYSNKIDKSRFDGKSVKDAQRLQREYQQMLQNETFKNNYFETFGVPIEEPFKKYWRKNTLAFFYNVKEGQIKDFKRGEFKRFSTKLKGRYKKTSLKEVLEDAKAEDFSNKYVI